MLQQSQNGYINPEFVESPKRRPRCSTVGATEDLPIRPPRIERGNHERPGLLKIDSETAETEVEISS
jgi:hypothetical protein